MEAFFLSGSLFLNLTCQPRQNEQLAHHQTSPDTSCQVLFSWQLSHVLHRVFNVGMVVAFDTDLGKAAGAGAEAV
jgi:hypothetical protein